MKDFWIEAPKKVKKLNKNRVRNTAITATVVVFLTMIITLYVTSAGAREWIDKNIFQKEIKQDNVVSIDINPDKSTKIYAYDKYITTLSDNILRIYNNSGKEEKNLNIEITNPIFESKNKYLAIAEEKGQKLYFIAGQEIAWDTQIEGNISKINVNKNGYTSIVITDTSYKAVIVLYNPEGKELFKTYLSSTRAIDTTISNDNKYLAIAEVDASGTTIQSNIKVISVDKAQTDADNSIVNTYKSETNKLITNIQYQDRNALVCMYNDSIDVIKNEETKTLENLTDKKITFASIELTNHISTIEEQSSGLFSAETVVKMKNISNEKENFYTASEVAKEIYANENIVCLNFGAEAHFVNDSGWLVKKYISKQEITNIVMAENIAGIIYRDKIEIINI